MSVIDELHHCGRHNEVSANSVAQPREFVRTELREVRMATLQLCEEMLEGDIDVIVNVFAI